MTELAIAAALAIVALLFPGVAFKVGVGLLQVLVAILLFPFHLLGAALALAGGVLLLPVVILAAILVVPALVGGLVLVPLAPFALMIALLFGMVRWLRPWRSSARPPCPTAPGNAPRRWPPCSPSPLR